MAHVNPWAEFKSDIPPFMEQPFRLQPLEKKTSPAVTKTGLMDFYPMDLASVYPVLALEISGEEEILDLCAAPGGKALLILEQLRGGHLVSNEWSLNRRHRLKRVLADYLPEEILQRVELKGWDGNLIGKKHPDRFDKILVDAPCSGERHLLSEPKEMKRWSPARTKNLARRQYALLASAWDALKPGGRLVYSTCSISKTENDGVVAKLLKREGEKVILKNKDWDRGEATEFGWVILPTEKENWGPIYWSVMEKRG